MILKSSLLLDSLKSTLVERSRSERLEVLDMSYNKLDDNSIWEVLEAVKHNSSILKLHLTQGGRVSEQRLIYQICELLLNNRTLQELHLDAAIPERTADKMLTALNTNLSLVVWKSPGSAKLEKCVDANRVIRESVERGEEVEAEEFPELKEVIRGKLKILAVKQQITCMQQPSAVIQPSAMLMKELEKAKGRMEVKDLAKVLVEIFASMEGSAKEAKERAKTLEEKVKQLERASNDMNVRLNNLAADSKDRGVNLQEIPVSVTRRIQSLEDGLNSYVLALEDVRNTIKNSQRLEHNIENARKDINRLYDIVKDEDRKIIKLQEHLDNQSHFNAIKEAHKNASETKCGSDVPLSEIEGIKQKQIFFQHRLNVLEKAIEDSNKLHKMSIDNLSLGIKNVELSKSLSLLENKAVSKSFNAKELSNSPPYLTRKYKTIQEAKLEEDKSMNFKNPKSILEDSMNEGRAILKMRYSPELPASSNARGKLPGPSKELIESLKNRGFEFDA